jgi:hypothetical protein
MRGRRGRPRRQVGMAQTFGPLIEHQLARGATLEAAMANLRRRDPRWGSRATMMRLWGEYQVDKIVGPLWARLLEKKFS